MMEKQKPKKRYNIIIRDIVIKPRTPKNPFRPASGQGVEGFQGEAPKESKAPNGVKNALPASHSRAKRGWGVGSGSSLLKQGSRARKNCFLN